MPSRGSLDKSLPVSVGYSVYLDLFRVAAALIVVGAHAMMPVISGNHYVFPFGEDAVEAFFVLSGFVIASVAAGQENTFRTFAIARLSRLWSVLIPALVIAPLLIHFALSQMPPGQLIGSLASGLFVNEVWFLSLTPTVNVPLWSISFEFWYYAIFAVYAFAPRRWKWPSVAIAAAIASPQILLLMPGWILGAALYHCRSRVLMGRTAAIVLFIAGPIFVIAGHALHLAPLLQSLYRPLIGTHILYADMFFARDFIWQNLVGLALAIHLAAGYVLLRNADRVPNRISEIVRGAAALTYTIYLLHFPAELILTGRLHGMHDGLEKVVIVAVGATLISGAFGVVLDPLKVPLRNWMMRLAGASAHVAATLPAA